MARGVLRKVDAVTIRVPDLDAGLKFYTEVLGHEMKWRNDEAGQVGLGLPDSDTEIVLTLEHGYEPNWLVDSVDAAVALFANNGGSVVVEAFEIPVGHVGVVSDPFGNVLTLVDLTKGTYETDEHGSVTGVS